MTTNAQNVAVGTSRPLVGVPGTPAASFFITFTRASVQGFAFVSPGNRVPLKTTQPRRPRHDSLSGLKTRLLVLPCWALPSESKVGECSEVAADATYVIPEIAGFEIASRRRMKISAPRVANWRNFSRSRDGVDFLLARTFSQGLAFFPSDLPLSA